MIYDIIIIGGGPAGLTAAIYGQRAGMNCLVIEKECTGGNINESATVENIPGFEHISGQEFSEKLTAQAENCGADIIYQEVTDVIKTFNGYSVECNEEIYYDAHSVILATGTQHNTLGLNHEQELIGSNIHFCALCDGQFYADKTVCVVGGGNSAITEALFLSGLCKKVIVVQNLPNLTADEVLQWRLYDRPNVNILCDRSVVKYRIKDGLFVGIEAVIEDLHEDIDCDGVFLAIGLHPVTVSHWVVTNHEGYIIPEYCPDGMFVAGDCSATTEARQVVTACADGAVAATKASAYVSAIKTVDKKTV